MKFTLSKEEWYSQRDNRTNAVDGIAGFDNFRLGIIVDPAVMFQPQIQAMVLIAVNLSSRWCRNITLEIPGQCPELLLSSQTSLDSLLRKIIFEADPYVEYSTRRVDLEKADGLLIIGNSPGRVVPKAYFRINCDGWLAGIGFEKDTCQSKYGSRNILGAAMAACLGVSAIFRQAINHSTPQAFSDWYSLYDFHKNEESPTGIQNPNFQEDFDLGNVYQIGCGAVGSSLDFLFNLTGWKGRLFLIDFDKVGYTDCNRSLLFSAFDAMSQRYKADVCAELLQGKFDTVSFKGSYAEFINIKETPRPDLVLCLANEQNVWSVIQHNFPPLVLHATTTRNWGINLGRHIPLKEWCILCRFAEEAQKEHNFIPPCSESVINDLRSVQETKQVLGVLPFLSTASAILMAAEIAKLGLEGYPINNNFVQFSFKNPSEDLMVIPRVKNDDCICNTQQLEIYERFAGMSKFWKLTCVKKS